MKNRNTLNNPVLRSRWRAGLTALAFASWIGGIQAQTANMYSFSSNGGGSLHDMTGSAMLVPTGSYVSAITSIGFNFVYEGTTYTTFSANNYGSMRLGNTVIQNYQVQNLTGNQPLISPLSVDGDETGNWAEYKVSGTAPNRVLTVHWDHHAYSWDGGTYYIFQASLYESTNVIEFTYGTGGTMNWWSNYTAITGANPANYLNIRPGHVASSVDPTSLNAWPGNGRVYTFSPPAPCTTPAPGITNATNTSGCPGVSTNLTLQQATPGSGVSYQWQSSPDGSSWSNIALANSDTYASGPLTSTTWYQCLVTCSTGPSTVASTPVQIVVNAPAFTYYTYTGSQVLENFATWDTLCSPKDVPDNSWTNAPAFGPGTWRRSDTNLSESGWDNTLGGSGVTNSTTVESHVSAMPVAAPAARFHSRQAPASIQGMLDFHVDMSAGTGGELLRFEYINQFGSGTLVVLISTNGGSSFSQVGSTLTNTSSSWQVKEFPINSTSATTVIRLRGTTSGSGNDIGVDNLRIIPAVTCPAPTSPAASVIGSGTVGVSWTCNSCTGNYYVEYGAPGFTLGTGTVTGPFSSSPATISGLANGSYQAYVRQDCGGNGVSENAGPASFNLVAGDFCANAIDISTLGLPVDDSSLPLAASTTGAQNDYVTSACGSQPGADAVLFHDVEPGASLRFTPQSTGKLSIAIGGSCPGTTSLACTNGGYLPFGANVVAYGPWGDPTFLWTNNGCNTERVYVLEDGGLVYMWNYAYTPPGGPVCAVVNGVTVNTVNTGTGAGVSWSGTCSGNVIVEYGPAGFTPGTNASAGGGTVVAVNGTSTSISGLTLDTPYELYVRNDCGGGTYSGNGSPTPFTLVGGDDCSRIIDLATATSPFAGSTTGAHNDVTAHSCGSFGGGDVVLSYPLDAGSTISFFASHDYAANVSVLRGTSCPGNTELVCDADLAEFTWTNNTGSTQNVYWIQDGSSEGPFTLEWIVEGPCALGEEGDPCYAGPLFTSGMVNDQCECVGQGPVACNNDLTLEFQTDGNPGQTTWELVEQGSNFVVQSGGPLNPANSVETNFTCLPNGCFYLRVMDAAGDGMTTGGYILRTTGSNVRIIDNRNNFNGVFNGSVSQIAGGQGFCLPLGTDKPIFNHCDKLDWVTNKFIVASENTTVSGQYGVTNATSGYEFWFFDPNGSYSYRRFRNHATSDGFGSGATRACHFKVNGWINTVNTPHLPANTLLNVRIRGRVANSNLEFGPACQFKIDPALAACPRISLQDNPASNDFSCGVNKTFGGAANSSNRITAIPPQPIPSVASSNVRYQFRFRIPGEYPAPGSCIVRPIQTSAQLNLNWTTGEKLKCNTSYKVDVRVSLDGGATWCVAGGDPTCAAQPTAWGKVCDVNITTSTYCPGEFSEGASSMTHGNAGELTMYPNPNRGDQLFVNLSAVERGVNTVNVDIYDLTGKKVGSHSIAIQDGYLNSAMDLNSEFSNGMYLVNITAGSKTYTKRLVIQR